VTIWRIKSKYKGKGDSRAAREEGQGRGWWWKEGEGGRCVIEVDATRLGRDEASGRVFAGFGNDHMIIPTRAFTIPTAKLTANHHPEIPGLQVTYIISEAHLADTIFR
jgi:hypothetical protein